MQTVIVEVKLEIDCKEDEVEKIIQDMNYDFSYTKMIDDEYIENVLNEHNYIKDTKIIDFDNITKGI